MAARTKVLLAITAFTAVLALLSTAIFAFAPSEAQAAGGGMPGGGGEAAPGIGWGYLAAALATGLSSLGAGFAVAHVGAAAIGAITEKPELLGRVLILVGLAEGIAIYGLIISILILNRL